MQARKKTNLVENVKEINHRFHNRCKNTNEFLQNFLLNLYFFTFPTPYIF